MAKNFLVLVIFCSSSLFLSLNVNGDEIYTDTVNKTSTAISKKSKRAVGLDSLESRESNELPSRDDLGSSSSFAKRAPSGFTGMRGKKQYEYTDLSPNSLDWSFNDDDYNLNDIRYKKAPSGFNGVRGKKMDQLEYEKSLLDQLFRRLYEENDDFEDMSAYSRSNTALDEWENTIDKRAPSGFTGMRGKRPLSFPFDGGKRTPNAFFGVRGKRDYKRSAAEQFQPEFLGFRNKFVGVRGKKDSNTAKLHRLETQMLGLPVNNYRSLSRFLIDSPEYMSLKRAPSGFVGMRGKRQASRDDLDINF
ncbi:tachykinins isoform X2 [Episyrphus balteatus]|uniref:tachykinins isoform X2 n=1 Tax=Episyrphus balteatus TaxID=286459 RepID=UPI002484E07F|nr:tachykinins isoform X2 [Episyrphus balteatus]